MNKIRLSDAQKFKEYYIDEVNVKDEFIKTRLEKFGVLENHKIKLLFNNYGKSSFLIKVMDIKYAIDKKICDEIYVKDE